MGSVLLNGFPVKFKAVRKGLVRRLFSIWFYIRTMFFSEKNSEISCIFSNVLNDYGKGERLQGKVAERVKKPLILDRNQLIYDKHYSYVRFFHCPK